jgi:hypothetical protein
MAIRYTVAQKEFALKDRFHRRQQIVYGIGLDDITVPPCIQSCFHEVPRTVEAYDKNLRFGRELAYSATSINSSEPGKGNIEQDEVRAQLQGLLNCFYSI